MRQPAVVILDSVAPLSGKPGEGKSDFLVKLLKTLRDKGVPILYLAHEQKAKP